MKRIDTSTKYTDKFGSGKHGFTNGTPGSVAATALDATWFDHIQEEISNVVEGRGGVLNNAAYTQLLDAILARAFHSWRNVRPAPRTYKLRHLVADMSAAGNSYIEIPEFCDVEKIDAQIEGDMATGGASLTFYRNNVGGGLSLGAITFLASDTAGQVRSLSPAANHTLLDPEEYVGCTLATTNVTACRCWVTFHLRSHFDYVAWTDAAYDAANDYLYAVGYGSSEVWIARSRANANDWRRVYADSGVGYPYAAAFGNGIMVAAGSSGLILTSDDNGATWVQQTPGSSYSGTFYGLAYNGSTMWCAIGTSGQIQSSPAAADTWTSRRSGAETLQDICYSTPLGMWCAVGSGGTILTSTNGTSWTSRTSGTSNSLNSVVWDAANAQFVAVGGSGATADVCTSADGITWSHSSPAELGRAFGSLCYHEGWLVGCSNTYAMLSGDGGETWSERDVFATAPAELVPVSDGYVLAPCTYQIYASGNVA